MKKSLSTRNVLLNVRQFVADDSERGQRIQELNDQLSAAIATRANAATEALNILKDYLSHQSEVHGFNADLVAPAVGFNPVALAQLGATKKVTKKTKKKKKKVTKKVTKKRSTRRSGRAGKTFTTSDDVKIRNLSPKELQLVELLDDRDRKFTTTKMLVGKGIIPKENHATAKVNALRKKGAPIESARQARANDDRVSKKARGYRLISVG